MQNVPSSVIRQITKEIAEVLSNPIEGLTIRPNESNICVLEADLQGPEDTPYYGGMFSLRLVFDGEYPRSAPKGYFLTKVFHPNVSEKGDICVNTLKKDWSPELGIRHVLMVIRCLLVEPNPESALNEEAARLLLEQYDEYSARAKMMTSIHAMNPALRPSKLENKKAAGEGSAEPSTPTMPTSTTTAATPASLEKKKSLKRL
eukprot:PhF_6_TR6812/c0_g1_i1/m.9804/K10583/UBE2S, E2EPF; ubiquitin-conjugating enzyme E2 S